MFFRLTHVLKAAAYCANEGDHAYALIFSARANMFSADICVFFARVFFAHVLCSQSNFGSCKRRRVSLSLPPPLLLSACGMAAPSSSVKTIYDGVIQLRSGFLSSVSCMCASGRRTREWLFACVLSTVRANVTTNLQCWTCNGPFPPFCPRPTRPHTCRCCPGSAESQKNDVAKLVNVLEVT